jgi:hypothetical protein
MNPHRVLPLLLLFVAVRADPEFVGVLTSKESGKLFVVAASPGAPARLVKIGDEIDGYFVTEMMRRLKKWTPVRCQQKLESNQETAF